MDLALGSRHFPLFNRFSSGLRWEYDICRYAGTRNLTTLFDVGGNIGQTVRRLRRYFPDASIYSFEPVRETFKDLETECRRHAGAQAFCLALGAVEETRKIVLQEHCELNSLLFAAGADPGDSRPTENIEVRTADSFCAEHHVERIDLLKTDAQGCDLDVLRGAEGLLSAKKVSFVLTEVSFQPEDSMNQAFAPVHEYLTGHGYLLASIYDQYSYGPRLMFLGCANALYVHPGALEGSG